MPFPDLISGGFSPDAVSEIRKRLDTVRASGIRILFAIESGSRAWGFPSPDSDYDCRFVYLRPVEDHLKLNADRDVIEFPIEGEVDTGGWDLRKALLLTVKGNATIVEWVKSPHVYEQMAGFRERLSGLLERIVDPHLVAKHYFGLLKRHDHVFTDDGVKLKKVFYALRPVLSLKYMEARDFGELPPMNLQLLMQNVRIPTDLSDLIDVMIAEKSVTREMGTGKVPDAVSRFLIEARDHYGKILEAFSLPERALAAERHAAAERFYIDEIKAHYLQPGA
ncbi:nucleotidyltransferase domain-containing protein [Rhizobium sp. TH2]|uniref:nucleotidyltransferase domain-containing protein n=1 Tax=Rhizobium sp. TH2 TaxID=2775403 RepID=UPI0021585300|nr:nucleotidyltransferase domain-containing protein [Rhizobium sp. TH2]UVC08406.1 nucleotidyltransferase domain-containing protein [Rhizobium sp. TH2]